MGLNSPGTLSAQLPQRIVVYCSVKFRQTFAKPQQVICIGPIMFHPGNRIVIVNS